MLVVSKKQFLKKTSFAILSYKFPLFIYHYSGYRKNFDNFISKTLKSSSFFSLIDASLFNLNNKFFRGNSIIYSIKNRQKFNQTEVEKFFRNLDVSGSYNLFTFYQGYFLTKSQLSNILIFKTFFSLSSIGLLFVPLILNLFRIFMEPMTCLFRFNFLIK
jgi:hypothetical protein